MLYSEEFLEASTTKDRVKGGVLLFGVLMLSIKSKFQVLFMIGLVI